jgi:hypothetical protein
VQHERFMKESVGRTRGETDTMLRHAPKTRRSIARVNAALNTRVRRADITSHRPVGTAWTLKMSCVPSAGKGSFRGKRRSIVSSALQEGLCKRNRRLGPRWPWSRFRFGTTRQKRRYGIFLFVLSEQDNREIQRLDLPPHVLPL